MRRHRMLEQDAVNRRIGDRPRISLTSSRVVSSAGRPT
jgi:hypothetical protein